MSDLVVAHKCCMARMLPGEAELGSVQKPKRLSARVLQPVPVMLCLASAEQLSSSSMPF